MITALISGPNVGVLGFQSTSFTYTLAGGAFSGTDSVIITSNRVGDIITPSVGSPAAHTVTVTPLAGASSFTFKVTPIAAEVSALTFTGTSWADPASVNFTATVNEDVILNPIRKVILPVVIDPANPN